MTVQLLDVGICESCRVPSYLFISSNLEPDQSLRCVSCVSYEIPEYIDLLPILQDVNGCAACGRPEFIQTGANLTQRWEFIEANTSDGETVVMVHDACASSNDCNDCDRTYATTRFRAWRGRFHNSNRIDMTQFATFAIVDGDHRCDVCREEYMADNGGSDSFTACDSCEDITHMDNTQRFNGGDYCDNCYENNVMWCDNCETSYWDGNDCNCSDEDNGSIHSYSYRPTPYFFGKGQYHLGFELEVEARNGSRYDGAQIAQDTLGGHAYMKEDGSLSDGFEIVTHPHTLSDYQTAFDWDFIPKLKREGFRSWNTTSCGLHVHVSRTAFGTGEVLWNNPMRDTLILKRQSHELRFMKLIYDNQRQVERIAGRSNNNYATFEDKGRLVSKLKFGSQSSGRYSAINTENDATLEVRVFKGSLRKERVLSALEFVTASVEYTRDLKVTSKNQALSWLRFTAYVSDNLETYPNLALIMSESFASDATPDEN